MGLACLPSNPPFGGQPRFTCCPLPCRQPQIPSRTPSGELGAPAPTRRPAAVGEAAEPDVSGSTPLGVAVQDLGRLAIGACHRQTAYRDRLAPARLPPLLGMEDPPR